MIWTTPLTWNTSLLEAEGLGVVHLIGRNANGCPAEIKAYMLEGNWYDFQTGQKITNDVFKPCFFAKVRLPSVLNQLIEIAEKEAQQG